MRKFNWNHFSSWTAAVLFFSVSTAALAQFVWLDDKGGKQYSDMPPPASVPKNRILKAPGQASHSTVVPEDKTENEENAATQTIAKKEKAPMTMAEKNADFQKRKIEQAEKDKKSADEAKRLADKAKNCDRTRQYQKALEEGHRIAQTDKNGESSMISDEQRSQDLKETRQILNDCK